MMMDKILVASCLYFTFCGVSSPDVPLQEPSGHVRVGMLLKSEASAFLVIDA